MRAWLPILLCLSLQSAGAQPQAVHGGQQPPVVPPRPPAAMPVWLVQNSWDTAETVPAAFRKLSGGLPASGSGQFSLIGLNKLKERIGRYDIIVVDLRDESHGFLNGLPVSWFQGENQINWARRSRR